MRVTYYIIPIVLLVLAITVWGRVSVSSYTSTIPPEALPEASGDSSSDIYLSNRPLVWKSATRRTTGLGTLDDLEYIFSGNDPKYLGRLEFTYPLQMTVKENDIITVEIISNTQFTETNSFPPHATGILRIPQNKYNDGSRNRIEEIIRLYPIMSAELLAGNFAIKGQQKSRKSLATGSAAWVWDITASEAGTQTVTVLIEGELNQEGEKVAVTEKSIRQDIAVVDQPVTSRITVDNWISILSTNGLIGTLFLALGFFQSRKNKDTEEEIKRLNDKISVMEIPNEQSSKKASRRRKKRK